MTDARKVIRGILVEDAYYRGAAEGAPRLNAHGIFWLTDNPEVASEYAAQKSSASVREYSLKPEAVVVRLDDLSNDVVRELYRMVSQTRRWAFGEIAEKDWPSFADWGVLEAYAWAVPFLQEHGVDAVVVRDHTGRTAHESLAVLNLDVLKRREDDVG